MDLIIELLRKYENEQNIKYESLQKEINDIKNLNKNSSNIINTLTKEKEQLNEANKEMKNVSIIIRLTNEKIKLQKENELLLKKIEFLTNKKYNNIEIIKESNKDSNNYSKKRVEEIVECYTNDDNSKIIDISKTEINLDNNIESNNSNKNIEKLSNIKEHIKIENNIENNKEESIDINELPNNLEKKILELEENIIIDADNEDDELILKIKKIKGIRYFVDSDNFIYTIINDNELGEKIGQYEFNKHNLLKPKFY